MHDLSLILRFILDCLIFFFKIIIGLTNYFIGINSSFPFFFINFLLLSYLCWENKISEVITLLFEVINKEMYSSSSNLFFDENWRLLIILCKSYYMNIYRFHFLLESKINGGLYLDKVWDIPSDIYKLIPGLFSFSLVKCGKGFVITLRTLKVVLSSLPTFYPAAVFFTIVCLFGFFFGASVVDWVCIDSATINPMDTLEKGYSGNGLDPDASFLNDYKENTDKKSPSANEEVNFLSGRIFFVAVFIITFVVKC